MVMDFSDLANKFRKEPMTVPAPQVPGAESAVAVRNLLASVPDRDAVAAVVQGINERPDRDKIAGSLLVQLSKLEGTDSFGQHVEDGVFGSGGVNLTKYSRAGAGTTVMPAYVDSSNEVHVLLGRKAKDPKNPAAGLSDQFILLGGYMDPHGLKGDAKVTYDHTLAHCAARELKEESGLDVPAGVVPKSLGTRSQYNVTNDSRLQTIVEDYLVDFGKRDTAPVAKANDDVAQVVWVKASDITRVPGVAPQDFGSSQSRYRVNVGGQQFTIRDDHGPAIEAGIKNMREKVITSTVGHEPLNDNPSPEVGPEAQQRFTERLAARGHKPAEADMAWAKRDGVDPATRPASGERKL